MGSLHIGEERVLANVRGNVHPSFLKMVVSNVSFETLPDLNTMPQELKMATGPSFHDHADLAMASPATKRQRTNDGPPSAPTGNSPMAHKFKKLLTKLDQDLGGKTVTWNMLAPSSGAAKNLFGTELMSMVQQGKEPCGKYWILGKCPGCKNSHFFSQEPTGTTIAGLTKRLEARCRELVKQHSNKAKNA